MAKNRVGDDGSGAAKTPTANAGNNAADQQAPANENNGEDGECQAQVQQGVADTVWKVGCYKINPSTPSGQKFFILHMLVLPLIPITALVIQNSVTMNTLLGYQYRVKTIRNQVCKKRAKMQRLLAIA